MTNKGGAEVEHKEFKNSYGYCPKCGAPGKYRERGWNGNDECENGHKYPSRSALTRPTPNTGQVVEALNWQTGQDDERVNEVVTALYRRFKSWSKRGFTEDDVTWCEVKADVIELINTAIATTQPSDQAAIDKDFIEQYQKQVADLEAEIKALREALEKIASYEVRAHIQKPNQCAHDRYGFEECEDCLCEFADQALKERGE